VYGGIFIFYILFNLFAAFNIVTSIFVDKAMKLAQPDLETMLFEKRREEVKNARSLRELCVEADHNGSGSISFEEFAEIMADSRIRSHFELKGLDIKDAEMFFKMLTSITGDKDVEIGAFVAGCMKMKGFAMSVDLLSIGFELKLLAQVMKSMQRQVGELSEGLRPPICNSH